MSPFLARALVVAAVLPAACAGRASTPRGPAPPPARELAFEPVRIDAHPTPAGPRTRAYDARSLLDDGNDHLAAGRWDEALAAYDHLLADFPDSALAGAAVYNSGLALEGKGDLAGAAERYRRVVAGSPDAADDRHARFRLGALVAQLGRHIEAIELFERILERSDLAPPQRIEALARLGFSLVETGDWVGAEEVLRRGLAYARLVEGTTPLDDRYYVAMCQFYLAEIPRRQFARIPLRYPEEQLARDLEQKSRLFLLARDRYVKTVHLEHAYWATAAVHHVGAMYKEFWDHWMAVPVPQGYGPAEIQAYVAQLNQEPQLRRLLEKALVFHQRNVAMARKARVATDWSRASEAEADAIRDLLARQLRREYIYPRGATPPASSNVPRRRGPRGGSERPAGRPAGDGAAPGTSGTSGTNDGYLPPRVDL